MGELRLRGVEPRLTAHLAALISHHPTSKMWFGGTSRLPGGQSRSLRPAPFHESLKFLVEPIVPRSCCSVIGRVRPS